MVIIVNRLSDVRNPNRQLKTMVYPIIYMKNHPFGGAGCRNHPPVAIVSLSRADPLSTGLITYQVG